MLKSLLWKSNVKNQVINDSSIAILAADLNLGHIMTIMSKEPMVKLTPEMFLKAVSREATDILYRQSILKDFIRIENISNKLEYLIVHIDKMQSLHKILKPDLMLPKLLLRLKKLEEYCAVMNGLEDVFSTEELVNVSDEFVAISEELKAMNRNNSLHEIEEAVRQVKAITGIIKSIDLGININGKNDASESIVLSLNNYTYEKSCLIKKIMEADDVRFEKQSVTAEISIENSKPALIIQYELYRELEFLMKDDLVKIEKLLKPFEKLVTSELIDYRDEVTLYFGAVQLYNFMQENNYPMCFSEISDAVSVLDDFYSLQMAYEAKGADFYIKSKVVNNDIKVMEKESLMLITGPNDGGKTVLLQSLGIIQLLFQNGMLVPASRGELKIYKQIYSHFPKDENINIGAGRLGEEAGRVSDIIKKLGENSLVLFNEPYVTTSPAEGLDILRMSLNKLNEKGCMILLVTHYLDILDGWEAPMEIASYTLEIRNGQRTYKAKREKPEIYSHSIELAREYGIDEAGIFKLFNSRKKGIKGEQV